MTTVAQLIDYLQTLPQEAIIKVGKECMEKGGTYMGMFPIDLSKTEIIDFSIIPEDGDTIPSDSQSKIFAYLVA